MTGPAGRVALVQPTGDRPLATRVLMAAAGAPGGMVAVGPRAPDGERLRELMDGPYGIGAVIPAGRYASGDGHYERGAHDADPGEIEAAQAVAVPTGLVTPAALDPALDDLRAVISVLVHSARRAGRRVVADPAWPAPAASARPAPSSHLDGIGILVVTAPIVAERFRMDDRAVAALIRSLARVAGASRVAVMTTERVPQEQRRVWTDAGLDVIEGPSAWARAQGPGQTLYSHVIFTAAAARSSARRWVEETQPHAGRILYFPSLESRDVKRIQPITLPQETAGLDLMRVDTEEVLARAARWAHVIWCQWPDDAGVLRSWAPGTPVVEIPPAVAAGPPVPGSRDRTGVLVVAGEGHDVIGGHEDAALRALREVMPLVRRALPSAPWTVVAERPTPMLQLACAEAGARIVPEAELPEAMRGACLLLSAHGFGSGQPAVLMAAMEAGLPFVCTSWAAGDLDLGRLDGVARGHGYEDLATRTRQLLSDPGRWEAARSESDRLAAERYPAGRHHSAVRRALTMLGVTPVDGRPEWPAPAVPAQKRPFRNPRLPIRPAGLPGPGPLPAFVPKEERERYQLWNSRWGPSPRVLEAIGRELDGLAYRPVISVLMPVYNTDADVLLAAVGSVRAQTYGRWQLCMANDGSDRPETLKVLDSLRGEPGIVVVDRDAPSGISEATNAALAVATGEFVTFLDHDDELKPHALAQVARWLDADPSIDVLYTDEDKLDPDGRLYDPHIKPDWAPDQLTGQNYVCHLTVARRSLVEELGGLRKEFDGSQDYDLILRLAERTHRIAHIPEPLYSWRAVPGSAAAVADAKPYAIEAARRAVADALARRGYGDRVDTTARIGFFRPRYPVPGAPKVSIIIPTRDGRELLERCINSILDRTTYKNYEVVIIDNHSSQAPTLEYLQNGPWRTVRYPQPFNYARMMNLAARSVECDALLFLNNDTEIITPDWIEGLLEHAMRPEIGAVGCRLFFADGRAQHEGIITGIGGWAHSAKHSDYWARGELTRNVTAVTGACTMMRPSVYWRVGGNDERLRVAYNDVDLCLRIHQAGYEVVYTPYVELFHHESSTRGRFEHPEEGPLYGERWRIKENVDPYYSPMFEDFPPFLIKL